MQQGFRTPANERIGANLRGRRTEKGMSQADLANAMTGRGWPWHQQTVAQTESGKRPIRADELEVVADVFGTTAISFLWEPAEINEARFVYDAGTQVKLSWEAVAEAVFMLMIHRGRAGRTIAQHRRSKYERVHAAIEDVKARLREYPLEEAIWEGIRRYNDRGLIAEEGGAP
jgi:transcriptional regulator with XRE-family HTH domain